MTAADFVRQMQALLPPGKAWSRAASSVITKVLEGLAPEFARVQARADQMQLEINPVTSEEMLDEWEYQFGLPDTCGPAPTTVAARRAALSARLLQETGHNGADYEAIAVALGHADAEVIDRPYHPFCAGLSCAGDPLYSEEWVNVLYLGYIENLVTSPNDFSATWTATVGTASVATDVGYAPDGTLTADRITFTSSPSQLSYEIVGADVPSADTEFSVWLRSESGSIDVKIILDGDVTSETSTVQVDDVWQRFTVRHQSDDSTYRAALGFTGTTPETVLAWGASVGTTDPALECRMESAVQAHGIAVFGRPNEFFSSLEYRLVDSLGNFLVDGDGFLLV